MTAPYLLFEIVTRRYQSRKSIVLTTNKPFAEWASVFPNAACVHGVDLRGLDLSEQNLGRASLRGSAIDETTLFAGTNFAGASFAGVDLSRADLSHAIVGPTTSFAGATLSDGTQHGVNLSNEMHNKQFARGTTQFKGADRSRPQRIGVAPHRQRPAGRLSAARQWNARQRRCPIVEERARLSEVLGDEHGAARHLRQAQRLFAEVEATGHAERLAKELESTS